MSSDRVKLPDDGSGRSVAGALAHLTRLLSIVGELRQVSQQLLDGVRDSVEQMRPQRAHLPGGTEPARAAWLGSRYGMTPREAEVARLLEEGCSNSAIARRLGISPHTARHHTQRVLVKLGVHSRSAAGARLRREMGRSAYTA